MSDNMVSRTLSVHKEHELLLKLEAAGLNDDLAQKIIASKDNALALKLVVVAKNDGFEPSVSQNYAREIMGTNMFGVEDAIRIFGPAPEQYMLDILAMVPFPKHVLMRCKHTHVLVAVLPTPIMKIKELVGTSIFRKQSWYGEEFFVKTGGQIAWQLVRKSPAESSYNRDWLTQKQLVCPDEEIITAQVMVYTIVGHFLSTSERLFYNVIGRTTTLFAQTGHNVGIGFDEKGLILTAYAQSFSGPRVGAASAYKRFQ